MSKFSLAESASPVLTAIERAKQLIEAEKAAKAPTIMTRSGITDLANRVRQSEGQYGAQRVERAADEIPNLEKLYQDQALMRAFTGDNAQALMTMKPSDFERFAAPLDANLSDRSLQKIADITGFYNNGGFSDVPYLYINKKEQGTTGLPWITGHEGRHRNRVMDAAGEQAGLVQLLPRAELREPFPRRSQQEYIEALYKEMQMTDNRVKPERYDQHITDDANRVVDIKDVQRRAIELPEFYAQGGMVDSAPEEAIKNTIKDPQAFKMLDMDLANLALMSQPQPQRMSGGGAVHMEDGGFLNSIYKNVVPAHLRTFGETLMGDRTPITEKNFTPSELDQMRNAVMSSRKDREITNARVFDNDVKKAFKSGASDKELMAIMQKGPSQKIDQSVGYQHYPGGDVEVRRDTDFGHDASIRSTLGRFAYNKDANGNLIATDNYKFTNDLPRETRPTSDYAGMNTPEKLWTLAKDTAQMGGLETLPSRVGNAFIGADGRPVNVNLGAAPFAHGGAVHKADGGIIHMGKAGAVTDAALALEKAKRAAEKAAKANPAPLPRAPIKTDEEIMAIAQRMAPQVRGDFVRNPSGTQGVMGLSRKQWEREQGLVHDIRDTRPLEEPPVVDYKDLRGEVKVGIKGDPTLTDKTIYAVDNNVLREPSPQEGGSMYGVNSPAAWASGPIPATTVSNLSRNASRQYGNVPSFAEYVKMGNNSHAYAVHVSDALLQAMHPELMTKKALRGFNQLIKNGDPNYGRFPQWAGIENPEEAFLQLAAHPDLRQVFYNTATMPTVTSAYGMPNGLDVVHATLDPKLRNLETGATGRALVRIDPNVSSLPLSGHTTYERDIPGHSFGQTKFPMPYELSFPDTLKSIKENPAQAPQEFGSFGMVGPRQIIDDQFIDEINRYNQMMDDLLKKKNGGAVHMAEGGDVELPTGGLSADVGTNPLSIYNQNLPKPESSLRMHPRRKTAPIDDGEASTMDIARQLGIMAKEQAGEEWDTLKANPVRGALDILNRGMVAGNVGAPVDLVNMGLQGVNYLTKKAGIEGDWASEKPVMGSKWIEDKMNELGVTSDKKYPMLELAANFLNPIGITAGAVKLAGAGAKAIAPFATKVDDMVREIHASGAMPQPGLSIKDVTPKVLAPANEQGFYSPTEAAALNLQRKTGNGQAFLNDILKQENVRPDEINAMGLDTFLKDKKTVTAAEVQDFIAQNKMGLGESRYDDAITENAMGIPEHKETKFKQYSLPGGENYREVVLTLPQAPEHSEFARLDKKMHEDGLLPDDMQRWTELGSELGAEGRRQAKEGRYRTPHWEDTNPIAHLRMSDRVTDGKKTLLVDEVQSDWHQAGREQGYKAKESDVAQKAYRDYAGDLEKRYVAAIREEAPSIYLASDPADLENFVRKTVNQKSLNDMANALGEGDKYQQLYKDYNLEIGKNRQGVPDAPYKEDWYQLALRRAVKEAIDGGYDRVALPTGARVNERFDLSKQIDRIDYNKNPDGTYNMSAIKDGQEVFAKESLDEKELSGIIGKDVAKKIVGDEGSSAPKADRWEAEDGDVPEFKSLSGLDLQVGGEGNKKYYDEVYPNYLKKFGKKYGATVGETTVKHQQFGAPEPLHYMDITPAMREAFKTGIHMKKGGAVHFADSLDAMRHELIKAK